MLRTIQCLALFAALSTELGAQVLPRPGDLIRVRVERSNYVGRFVEATPEVIRLTLGRDSTVPVELVRPMVSRIEISRGPRRHFARNFAVTLAVAATAGALIGAVTWSPCTETGFLPCFLTPESRGEAATLGLGIGALVGLPFAVLVGLNESEEWVPVALSPQTTSHLRLRPMLGDRPGIHASFIVLRF